MRYRPARSRRSLLIASITAVVAIVNACSDGSLTGTSPEPQFAANGGGPPVKVTSADPPAGEQGTAISVRILGSNFEPGSVAEFELQGVPGKVHTNSTLYVSDSELLADITIDTDAEPGLYDVAVTTPRGKKGVGTELFEVFLAGGGPQSRLSIDMVIADLTSGLRSDGEGTYIDQDCGVYAWLSGVAFMNPDAARIEREDRSRCGDGRRAWASVEGVEYLLTNIHLRPDDWYTPANAVGTVNAGTVCMFVSGNGNKISGKGLRFNPADYVGSDGLNVEKLSATSWRFWTSPYPDNKGWCEDDTGIRLVHFDLDVTVSLH